MMKTCRLCGEETTDYVSIFEENDHWIAEKISRCLPIIVLSSDKLPNHVCNHCLYCLNTSHAFLNKCISVDAMLRQRSVEIESAQTKKSRMTLTELKRKAMAGPVDCELCDQKFDDLDLFDDHIEITHMLPWKCNFCDKSFDESVQLIAHKSLEHEGQIIICANCENCAMVPTKTYISPMEIHTYSKPVVQINNDKNKFKSKFTLFCDVCKIGFGDKHYFNGHNKIHESVPTNCSSCQVECNSVYDLFLHKRDLHNMYKKVQLKYVCEQCGKFFTNSWQWETHKTVCSNKLVENSCKYCGTTFTTKYKLTRHLRQHKTEMFNDPSATVYRCIACPKIFVDKEFYEKHRNVHDPECWDKFKCNSCNRSFRDNVRLKEHQKSIHQGIKPHRCDLCERTFHRLSNLRAHRQVHIGRKCSMCGTTYPKLKDFMNHMKQQHPNDIDAKTHSLIRRSHRRRTSRTYICRYCGKKLSSYKSVLDHEHIHTGDKPYSCRICHKSFSSYSARWTHEHRHEKGNFICEHCGKCFSYKQNLTIHIKTHGTMQERKHACPTCEKRFLRKCHLNIHMRIHNGIRPYTCDICSFSFTQKGDMRRHRLRHNKIQSNRKTTRRVKFEEPIQEVVVDDDNNQ